MSLVDRACHRRVALTPFGISSFYFLIKNRKHKILIKFNRFNLFHFIIFLHNNCSRPWLGAPPMPTYAVGNCQHRRNSHHYKQNGWIRVCTLKYR